MNFRDLTIGAYAKLHDVMASGEIQPLGQVLGYEYSAGQPDFIYGMQEGDFTRELVNELNQYVYWLNRIALWESVLTGYSEYDKLEIRFEFTARPLDYCLHFPYKFKSRVAFCATQLCYTKGIAAQLITKDEVQPDDKINLKALKTVAHHWPTGSKLIKALESIDGKQYRQSTSNYRNKAQHRHPQRLDFGRTTNVIRRFPADATVSYSFGETLPLVASAVLPVLAAEAEHMKTGFFAYRALVDEHTHAKSKT